MSIAGLSMAKVQEALKLFYLDGLKEQINYKTDPFLTKIDQGSQGVSGSKIVMALRYGRNGGVGNRADDGDLPTPSSRKIKQAKWVTKNIFARIMLTKKTMEASKSNKGAFVNLLEAELEDAQVDAKENMARQLYGDGTGKITNTKANTSKTTLEVNNTIYFAEGMRIDVIKDADKSLIASEVEITAVDHDAGTITISGSAITTVAEDFITVAGSYNEELTGLGAIFTPNSTIYEIDRSSYKFMNPNIITIGGEISEVGIQKGIDKAEIYAGSEIDFLMTTHGVSRAYQNLLTATKRTVNTLDLKGGFKALEYNGMPLVRSKYVESGAMYQLSSKDFQLYQMADWDWLDEDGAILSRVANKAAFEATLYKFADLGCSRIKGQTKLTEITEH